MAKVLNSQSRRPVFLRLAVPGVAELLSEMHVLCKTFALVDSNTAVLLQLSRSDDGAYQLLRKPGHPATVASLQATLRRMLSTAVTSEHVPLKDVDHVRVTALSYSRVPKPFFAVQFGEPLWSGNVAFNVQAKAPKEPKPTVSDLPFGFIFAADPSSRTGQDQVPEVQGSDADAQDEER